MNNTQYETQALADALRDALGREVFWRAQCIAMNATIAAKDAEISAGQTACVMPSTMAAGESRVA